MGIKHIVKYTHDDGVELKTPTTWCGAPGDGFCFTDAQHAALSLERGQLAFPCPKCRKKIIEALSIDLK